MISIDCREIAIHRREENTIEHPELHRIQLIGYPNAEYLEWEQRLAEEEIVEGEWPDGLTHSEWQKEKRSLGKANA